MRKLGLTVSASILASIPTVAAGLLMAGVAMAQGAAPPAKEPARVKGDRELGEYLSSQCTGCHQITGRAVGGVPPIVAWPEDAFMAVMQSYKQGERENETMRVISHRLSLEEVAALAAYFGSLPDQSKK